MERTCRKCGAVNSSADGSESEACPKCGVIYSKAEKVFELRAKLENQKNTSTTPPRRVSPSFPSSVRENAAGSVKSTNLVKYAAVGLFGVVIGFFAGREYMRYQIAMAFADAAKGAMAAIGGGASPITAQKTLEAPKPEAPKAAVEDHDPFTVQLTKKSFREANFHDSYVSPAVEFTLVFVNTTGQSVRAFDGVLTFTDLLDNKLISVHTAINDAATPGRALTWEGELNYNQFMDSHQRLKEARIENLKIKFHTTKVLFSDGTTKTY